MEDLAISATEKIAALVEMPERKGVCPRGEIYVAISGWVTASPSEDI